MEVQEELLEHLSNQRTVHVSWDERRKTLRDIAGTVGKQALWGLLDVWFDTKPKIAV